MSREINVGGKRYRPAVLLVTDRDHLGRPLTARFIQRDEKVNLKELGADRGRPPEFLVVYARVNEVDP